MQLIELEDKLEDMQTELSTIYETTNLIYLALSFGTAGTDDVMYVLGNAVCRMEKAVKETENLIQETIRMRSCV